MKALAIGLTGLVLCGCGSSAEDSDSPGGTSGAKALGVTTGGSFSCALMADRTVRCWGSNIHGQLGDGTTSSAAAPILVQGLSDVAQVSAGGNFACALKTDGSVWCWGRGSDGELGDGKKQDSSVPVQVAGLAGITQIACGSLHSCAITGSGQIFCWGANNVAQLGSSPPLVDGSTPLPVAGLFGATAISAGALHSCAIAAGIVQCWGGGPIGTDGVYTVPTPLPNGADFASLAPTGSAHLCGVRKDSSVACWGMNDVGQLGRPTPEYSAEPLSVPGLQNVVSVSSGASGLQFLFVFPSSNCAVIADGSVSCWGNNQGGELGDGTTTDRAAPAPVPGLSGITAVAVGATDAVEYTAHVCALHDSGDVSCWGSNNLGELGDGTTTARSTPAKVTF